VAYVVLDTCVFTRLEGKYSKVFECIQRSGEIIAVSKEVLKEYVMQAEADILIFQSFLQELMNNGRMKNINRSYIEAKLKRVRRRRALAYPQDTQDSKWVELAVSTGATHILSTDPDLLSLPPNPCNNHNVKCIDPQSYLEQQCPDLV
jgi:putative PIN family toxin of toxin-antitoxin system